MGRGGRVVRTADAMAQQVERYLGEVTNRAPLCHSLPIDAMERGEAMSWEAWVVLGPGYKTDQKWWGM